MYPVELLKLGQLHRRIRRLGLEGGGIVDDQGKILMSRQRRHHGAHLLFPGEVRLYQLDAHVSQTIQLGPFAAIAARHLPTSGHQLLAQIESQATATARYQCTHTLSLWLSPSPIHAGSHGGPIHRP